jgi:hypothetical protein
VDEIENFDPPPKRKKQGAPLVSTAERKECSSALGKLVRALNRLDLYDQFSDALSQIAEAIKRV